MLFLNSWLRYSINVLNERFVICILRWWCGEHPALYGEQVAQHIVFPMGYAGRQHHWAGAGGAAADFYGAAVSAPAPAPPPPEASESQNPADEEADGTLGKRLTKPSAA